jgi:SNF2 family DNA or RNA helicase
MQTAENQAIDRVHRLGQTQDVIAKRYIVENSIEEVRSDVSREPQEAKASRS